MGIYGGADRVKYLKYGLLIIFLVADLYLLLPPRYFLEVDSDVPVVGPGEEATLWVKVHNNTGVPLTGALVTIDTRSRDILADTRSIDILSLPPEGVYTKGIKIRVSGDAVLGDHLVRLFFSYPGRTEVVYRRVRVG